MSPINICFSTTNGWFSRLIRWFTRSKVSHALITFRDDTLQKVFVMEANGRGFMLVPWAKWKRHNRIVARYRIVYDTNKQAESLRLMASKLGAEYDYIGIFGFLLRRFAKRMKNPFDNPSRMFCSEVVSQFLFGAGMSQFKDTETWTPQDLLEAADSHKSFVEIPTNERFLHQNNGHEASE